MEEKIAAAAKKRAIERIRKQKMKEFMAENCYNPLIANKRPIK
jgi:hypothetical protein